VFCSTYSATERATTVPIFLLPHRGLLDTKEVHLCCTTQTKMSKRWHHIELRCEEQQRARVYGKAQTSPDQNIHLETKILVMKEFPTSISGSSHIKAKK
jgi:hypothetical protein